MADSVSSNEQVLLRAENETLTHEVQRWVDLANWSAKEVERLRAAQRYTAVLLRDWLDWDRSDIAVRDALVKATQAALAGSVPETTQDQTAWLIEMAGREHGEPLYWHAEPDARCIGGFDPDPNKAMRFCREKDARAMALMLGAKGMIALTDVRRVKITEHAWPAVKAGEHS